MGVVEATARAAAVAAVGEAARADLVVAVVGPTATGKSDLGIALALALGGEVVNTDAMQLYRGMDIGTAKVPPAQRRGVPHHLLDVLDPAQDATVADYQRQGRAVLADLKARSRIPVAVGGSGLYVRGLLDRLDFPGTDPQLRAELEARADEQGSRALYGELVAADPVAAERIGPHNTRRVVRALEVIALTGRPYSSALPEHVYQVPAVQIGLDCDRAVLDERVAARVARMWAAGLADEVDRLVAAGGLGRTAARAVGYAQVLALRAGRLTERQAYGQTVVATRRLARRQMGWFGRDPRVHWLDAQHPDLAEQALDLLARARAGELPDPGVRTRRLGS
ncbi:MAG: tRNA (adenosine(37)-N6)-dimethylallyltransferase MiaA [Micrococcales bacterium]|nr:tRNA (adenosine(37)-N6)-dimethylallyltransferase MiaA [Micrococcales bacterium]